MYFPRCRIGPLSDVSCIECHQFFWRKYGVGWACSCISIAFRWSSVHPCLASLSACSLPFILAWALTLWRVVVCVRICSIVTMDSSIVLSGWLLCRVGCLVCVLMRYNTACIANRPSICPSVDGHRIVERAGSFFCRWGTKLMNKYF